MIILIGGNSCTGKTLMSQKLLEQLKIPYLSIDHLKMGLYKCIKNHMNYFEIDKNYEKEIKKVYDFIICNPSLTIL